MLGARAACLNVSTRRVFQTLTPSFHASSPSVRFNAHIHTITPTTPRISTTTNPATTASIPRTTTSCISPHAHPSRSASSESFHPSSIPIIPSIPTSQTSTSNHIIMKLGLFGLIETQSLGASLAHLIHTYDHQQTHHWTSSIRDDAYQCRQRRKGLLICVHGGIGIGKTTLIQSIITYLYRYHDQQQGVKTNIPMIMSPTYTLDQEYRIGSMIVHHMDLYRLYAAHQLSVLRLPLLIAHDIVLMEWSDRLLLTQGAWPENRLDVIIQDVSNDQFETELSAAEDGEDRTVTLVSHGDLWFQLLEQINNDHKSKISDYVLETQTITSQAVK